MLLEGAMYAGDRQLTASLRTFALLFLFCLLPWKSCLDVSNGCEVGWRSFERRRRRRRRCVTAQCPFGVLGTLRVEERSTWAQSALSGIALLLRFRT